MSVSVHGGLRVCLWSAGLPQVKQRVCALTAGQWAVQAGRPRDVVVQVRLVAFDVRPSATVKQ